MLRRTFITALPIGLFAATPALAKPRSGKPVALVYGGRTRLHGVTAYASEATVKPMLVQAIGKNGSHILSLKSGSTATLPSKAVIGLCFGDLPGFKQGVAFWRYAPWKSWTKPMAMTRASDLQGDDVQFAYWQYDDGAYGVALPLGGGGFRTTLGSDGDKLVTVGRALGPARPTRPMPQVAIAFGGDLYATITAVFEDAMDALGTPENLRKHKVIPDALTNLGWNTWNASNLGKDLAADWVLAQVGKIKAAGAPIRTVVLDDGHFQAVDNQLQSLQPNTIKFPGGFKPLVDRLINDHGLKHVGLWHAFDAYWNGIDPQSELGKKHTSELFSWTQTTSPTDTSGKLVTYSFLKPDPDILNPYFDTYYADLKAAGISLLKVDNQLVAERMAKDNYPVWDLATAIHNAINTGAAKHFDNALINCMDMTNDAFLNFGTTAVARSVEDYFPYKPSETYDLQEGNAAAHCLQAIYNALWFGEMVFPDFDMFESTNPNAALHASVRAANCAPIYVTDKAGEHNVPMLKSLVDAEGVTLRSDTPLRPTKDCLFQIQSPVLFKASSLTGDGALLLLANLADADSVSGECRLSDITGLPTGAYVGYSHFGETVYSAAWDQAFPIRCRRFMHELVRIAPLKHGKAVFGLKEKLNGLASVTNLAWNGDKLSLTARDEGALLIYSVNAPASVRVDNQTATFTYQNNLLTIPLTDGARAYRVTVA